MSFVLFKLNGPGIDLSESVDFPEIFNEIENTIIMENPNPFYFE